MLERIYLRFYLLILDLKDLVISVVCNKRASAKIPKRILEELARCFLPDIIAFCESVEGRDGCLPKLDKRLRTPHRAPKR